MAEIEINGKKVEAEPGSMIIEAADNIGVWIPRFCYHRKLSIAANCRMCLVDVEKAPKPLPACATPITEGMKIWTQSRKALMAQQSVMEFLLINHPLDCPICDQGGECELQDIALGYGSSISRFTEGKRSIKDQDIGPLVATDMTRCIQCTRCVRFGTEVAGMRELGATGRGEHMEIGTFIERSLESEVSGNIIDLCPVGALTSKPYRFKARGWELTQLPSIAPHDCVGSNIFVHVRRNEVMRVVPRENESINEVWISDRDRFSYEAVYQDRISQPLIKEQGQWREVSWQQALEWTSQQLKATAETDPTAIGALASPNSTTEEFYLLQKLLRGLGSNNIDHRLRQLDCRDQDKYPAFPNIGLPLAEIEQQSTILLIGSDIRAEQPMLGLKLRKMVLRSGKMLVINPIDFPLNFDTTAKMIVEGGDLCRGLSEVAKALLTLLKGSTRAIPTGAVQWLNEVKPNQVANQMAKILTENNNSLILIGSLGLNSSEASRLIALANLISQLTTAKFGVLTEGANSAGGWIAGCIPHRQNGGQAVQQPGLTAIEMSRRSLSAMILMNLEPDLDCAAGFDLLENLKKTPVVIALSPFHSQSLKEVAHVILPIVPFTENAGTYINAEGTWQSFSAVATLMAEARPAWKILRVLGNELGLEGFDFNSVLDILYELKNSLSSGQQLDSWEWNCPKDLGLLKSNQTIRIAPVPRYATDNLVRRATALQAAQGALGDRIGVGSELAHQLGIQSGETIRLRVADKSMTFLANIDESLPNRVIVAPMALQATLALGSPYQAVEVHRL